MTTPVGVPDDCGVGSQTFWAYPTYAAEPAEAVAQYSITLVNNRSRPMISSGRASGGCVHALNFSTIQARRPTGESTNDAPIVAGSCRLDGDVSELVAHEGLDTIHTVTFEVRHGTEFLVGHLFDGHPDATVDVDSDHPVWRCTTDCRRYARTDVSALDTELVVAESVHQFDPAASYAVSVPTFVTKWGGEAETWKRRHDNVKGVGRIAPEPSWIAQRPKKIDEFYERSWPSMGEDKRQRVRFRVSVRAGSGSEFRRSGCGSEGCR